MRLGVCSKHLTVCHSPLFFVAVVLWRRSGWAWQQGQLFGGDQWRHGCGHRFLGQLPQDMELTSLDGTSGSHSFWSQSHCSAPLPHRTPPSPSPPYRRPDFLLSALSHYPTVSQRGEDQQWRASAGSLCLSGFTSRLERCGTDCVVYIRHSLCLYV